MDNLEKNFKRHLHRRRFFDKSDRVLVAVSTGLDSMVLLDLLQHLAPEDRPQLLVAHVNHELRQQSSVEEQFIRQYCAQHGIELVVRHWPRVDHPASGTEEAARRFRYRFFAETMEERRANILVTAHHQNDLAETMLMNLVRGGQLSQLVGIADDRPFASGRLIRPLLPFSKQELRVFANRHQLKWFEDQTNHDLSITRNRYRHVIIPLLEKENPQVLNHLADYHRQLTTLLEWQGRQLDEQLSKLAHDEYLLLAPWLRLPATTQKMLLQHWLEKNVSKVKQSQLNELRSALANAARPQQRLPLPGGWLLIKEYDRCFIKRAGKLSKSGDNVEATVVKLGQWYPVGNRREIILTASMLPSSVTAQEQWLAPAQFPLSLRRWQPGDAIRLKNGGRQTVRRILINQKVPNEQRRQQLVLTDSQGAIIWVVGRKWSWFSRPVDYRRRWRKINIGIQQIEEN